MNLIQKILNNFDYKKKCEYWQSIAIEKARELALMAKVADLWQRRLIEANERIEKLEGLLNDRPSASD